MLVFAILGFFAIVIFEKIVGEIETILDLNRIMRLFYIIVLAFYAFVFADQC